MNLITQWSRHNAIIAFVRKNTHKLQMFCKKDKKMNYDEMVRIKAKASIYILFRNLIFDLIMMVI